MAGNNSKISTEEILQIATNIERLNKELSEKLAESKDTIEGLANIWQGEASQNTISSFNSFASKYFQTYEDILQKYVVFLRKNVAEGYFNVETENVKLSESFK